MSRSSRSISFSSQSRKSTPLSMASGGVPDRVATASPSKQDRQSVLGRPIIDFSKKLVVVGDGGCGKTCLLISYAQGYFPEKYVPTVFENYITIKTHRASGKNVELALWDTAGQEEYDRLRPLSYPETDVIFVCFAVDSPHSLENVMDKWFPEVSHFCPGTPVILVGLKTDLRGNKHAVELLKTQGMTPVTQQQAEAVAAKMQSKYVECSAKTGAGVERVFDLAMGMAIGTEGGSGSKKKKRRNCKIL